MRLLLVCLIITETFAAARAFAQEPSGTWSGSISSEGGTPGKNGIYLRIGRVEKTLLHLIGGFWLNQELSHGQTPSKLIVYGHSGDDAMFQPNVLLEVKDESTRSWKIIAKSFAEPPTVTLTIEPGTRPLLINVILDAFEPFIGKSKVGRITLQNGESVEFRLELLTEKGFRS